MRNGRAVNVRGVEIEVASVAPGETGADVAAAPALPTGPPADEATVRSACAAAIAGAAGSGAASVALPAYGVGAGMTPVISGKILVQEAVRAARAGATSIRRIVLCCPDPGARDAFRRTVNGYLRHLLEVLIWGPFVTVDAIIEVPAGIVVIRRSNPPLGFALPGGFVDYGETLEAAVRREAMEETGLELLDVAQFHTYSDPARDPRFHAVSTVFTARADGTPRAGDDAADARVVTVEEARGLSFAFDHGQVLADWLARRGAAMRGAGPGSAGQDQSP